MGKNKKNIKIFDRLCYKGGFAQAKYNLGLYIPEIIYELNGRAGHRRV